MTFRGKKIFVSCYHCVEVVSLVNSTLSGFPQPMDTGRVIVVVDGRSHSVVVVEDIVVSLVNSHLSWKNRISPN
jgi:hypothetical protein